MVNVTAFSTGPICASESACTCTTWIGISTWLIDGFPWKFFVWYAALYTPLISYASAKLEGIAGQAVALPYIREAAYILSGAAALLILHTAVVFLLAALGRYTRKDEEQPALQALPKAKSATVDEVTALPENGGDTRDTGGDSASEDGEND